MEDETEVLDWGHEEESALVAHDDEQRTFSAGDDVEDAVSLGGDEEDEFLTYQSRAPQDRRSHSPPKSARHPKLDPPTTADSPRTRQPQEQEQTVERTASTALPPLNRAHAFGTLEHPLPPKPVVSSVPFVHPSHPSIIEATAMASRLDREKRNGTDTKTARFDYNDPLPPGWEVKYPRNGQGIYYYNIHTQESTWTRPTVHSTREKRTERSDLRDDPLDQPLSSRNGAVLIPRVGRADSGEDMSYTDRHYRPGESTRREERPAPPAQLIDSYVPDSYSPNHRTSRPSSPPPRARERDPTPPSRRRLTPDESCGDRDGVHASRREPLPMAARSAQDRFRASRPTVPHERPRERRERDDLTPSETDRRNPPRDSERSSATRPRSPASYTRDSQHSGNVSPQHHNNPLQPVMDLAPSRRKTRFSQPEGAPQQSHRHPETHDGGMRRTRTEDAPHSARYVDDFPSSRSMTDVRPDDDTPTHPASDAQRSGSRKRTPLPPQEAAYRPGTRPAPVQRSAAVYPPGPAPATAPENRHTSRTVLDEPSRDLRRRTPSPPPELDPPAERSDRDRGRWSNSYANGPSRTMHESSRGRVYDVTMDVDEPPLPRSFDAPTRQVPPRRPAVQDDVPRFPRAMLNADNDGLSRGSREVRDGNDSRYRSGFESYPRFGPQRDRPGMDRLSTDQHTSQKEPVHGIETRPPPSGSNVKLSGTNNIPVGNRNKFTTTVPPPAMPQSGTRHISTGSNGEPFAPRRDRMNKDLEGPSPPRLDSRDQNASFEPARREDIRRSPLPISRAPPVVEPAPPPPTRPSRAALGTSRFGPPITKEHNEPVHPQMNVSTDSLSSEQVPEDFSRASPPPPSRESSTASFKEAASLPNRPAHLPPRPASPPGGYRHRDDNKPYHRPNARNSIANDFVEAPARPRPSSPAWKQSTTNARPSEPPLGPRGNRDAYSPEQRPRTIVRDFETDHHVVARPPPPPVPPPVVVVQEDLERDRAPVPPLIHHERALMLANNGLPPRPLSSLGPPGPGRGIKRDHNLREIYERVDTRKARYASKSPVGERRRYPEEERSYTGGIGGGGGMGGTGVGPGPGASLLDRLSLDEGSRVNVPSLRDRVQLPSKRDREEMLSGELPSFDVVEGEEYYDGKRARRRGGIKMRKARY